MLRGVDMNHAEFPIDSPNPKIYLPLGNCLMGHIPDQNAMAVAFMHSAGVRQMCGYVVSTWFGYGGWGIRDYFLDQPGRFSLAEAFYANNQALVHELETRFPKHARFDNDQWNIETDQATIGRIAEKLDYKQWNDDVKTNVGLIWDRDTVAFYGDPAWDACAWRLAICRGSSPSQKRLAFTRSKSSRSKRRVGAGRPSPFCRIELEMRK